MAEPPSFLSLAFHLEFLPGVIRQRLRPPPSRGGFVSSAVLEFSLLMAVCAALLAISVPALSGGSPNVGAWVLAIVGAGGILAMLTVSVRSTLGEPLRYERFEPAVFFFMIVLGATVGLWTGFLSDPDRGSLFRESHALTHSLLAFGGALLGYFAGIAAGLWVQKLGPLAGMVTVWALPGIVGLLVTDLVILSI